jgi:CRISPR-associated endonuclease Csn1
MLEIQAIQVKEHLRGNKTMTSRKLSYRLGLDMGTTSIGWAMLRLDVKSEPCAIIRMGVRIFSDGRNPKDGASLAVTRRLARQMRRRRDRLLKRRARMLNALIKLGFFPSDEAQRKQLAVLDPYALRAKGLREALTGPEFARALFHINQRRGFLSNRKTDKKDNESGALKKAIKDLREKLSTENCQTLGEWLAKRHEQKLSVRARLRGKTQKDKAYDFYADRAMIKHEFDTLWAKQQSLNPVLFSEQARAELDDILFHQRELKPVEPGRCSLLPDERRAPLALPSTQHFRILQELNNLRILGLGMEETPLTLTQRNVVANLLERNGKVLFSSMVKALKLPGTTKFNLQDSKRDGLKGNATSAALAKKGVMGEAWHELPLHQQDEVTHQLLSEASEQVLVTWLTTQLGIDERSATEMATAGLPESYGRLSESAMALILPELDAEVITYDKAVERAGLGSHSMLSHGQTTGEFMQELPYYGQVLQRHVAFAKDNPQNDEERYGKIANPTVHIGLNELRKVVNGLIKQYGVPHDIIVEVTRDLKLSRERKNEIQREQADKQRRNDRLVADACVVLGLSPDTMDRNKRRLLSQKMQLWHELSDDEADKRCPYTGEQIGLARLLSDEVEIEHILPFSLTLDDSMSNKTVALRRANRDKGNRTPFQAFGKTPEPGYDYEAILQRAALMPLQKRRRFAPDGLERWLKEDKNFLARALNDTAYLSTIAREYLSVLYPSNMVRVQAIPGRLTAMLRGKFALNQLLSGSENKNRNDHRHHALDAAVIGVTDARMLKRFAEASARTRELGLQRLVDDMPLPWDSYREHVQRGLKAITVSHRPDHGYQGPMHEETAWGILNEGQATRRVRPEGGGNKIREIANKTLVPITSTRDPNRHGTNDDGQPVAYKGYVGGSNHCLEVWRDDTGKVQGSVISTFEVYQHVREVGEQAVLRKLQDDRYALNGKPLLARLINNDTVRLEIDGRVRTMRVVKIFSSGQFFMCDLHEANADTRSKDKDDAFTYESKMPGSFIKAKGRKVTIAPTGQLRDPGAR